MQNNIQIYNHTEFGKVRVIMKDNEPWFVGKDVAKALGYGEGKSLQNAVANHVDSDDKGVTKMMTPGGNQQVTIINESGLYSLIMSSKLPSAKAFKRWVTSDVLPSIRKTGSYSVGTIALPDFNDPVAAARAWADEKEKSLRLEKENSQLTEQNNILTPKGHVYDIAMDDTKGLLTIGAVAKMILFKDKDGKPIGRNSLYKKLRECKVFDAYNQPYQQYVNLGYFKVIDKQCTDDRMRSVTLVYQKGLDFIIRTLEKAGCSAVKERELDLFK